MEDITGLDAGEVIRRVMAGHDLTVSELARRSGIHRVQLHRYATGAVQPGWATLAKVLAGAGVRVTISPGRPSAALARHREAVVAAGRALGLSAGTLFGSTARGEDVPGSDVDILVDGDMDRWALRAAAFDLAEELTALPEVGVDVVTEPSALPAVVRAAKREGVALWKDDPDASVDARAVVEPGGIEGG